MGRVLQTVAVVLVLLAWAGCAVFYLGVLKNPASAALMGLNRDTTAAFAGVVAVWALLAGLVLFVLGQMANDARAMRNSLAEMVRMLRGGNS